MNDNLATRNNLVLLLENAAAPIPNPRSASPSHAALLAAEALNRPILRLVGKGDAPALDNTARVVATLQTKSAVNWPCELSMDALKLGRHTTTSVRARLARRSFDHRFSSPPGCTALPAGDLVDTTALFSATPAATAGVTALTMGGAVDAVTKPGSRGVHLPEMEWATVEWEWPERAHGVSAGCGGAIVAPHVSGPASQGPSALGSGAATSSGSGAGSTECGAIAPRFPRSLSHSPARSLHLPRSLHVCLSSDCGRACDAHADFEDSVDWLPASDDARPAGSKEVCCAECHATSGCKAGVFIADSGQCWLKFSLGGGQMSAPGAVSCKMK